MSPLLQQFLAEARECLQGIAEKLMQLEKAPTDGALMTELFRLVHTLKGNSGLFEFPEMTHVLHAGEDLLDKVRNGEVDFSIKLADRLLDAMDFVGMLCDDIESHEKISGAYASDSARLTESLRQLHATSSAPEESAEATPVAGTAKKLTATLADIPEEARLAAYRSTLQGNPLHWVIYCPEEGCFFQGDDPFFQAQLTPGLLDCKVVAREAWPALAQMDAYRCVLDFYILSNAPLDAINEHYRYMPEQIRIAPLEALRLVIPSGDPNGGPVYEDFVTEALALLEKKNGNGLQRATETMLELASPQLWLSSALRWLLLVLELEPENTPVLKGIIISLRSLTPYDWSGLQQQSAQQAPPTVVVAPPEPPPAPVIEIAPPPPRIELTEKAKNLIAIQRVILELPIKETWHIGRMRAAANVLRSCFAILGDDVQLARLQAATELALKQGNPAPLLRWLDDKPEPELPAEPTPEPVLEPKLPAAPEPTPEPKLPTAPEPTPEPVMPEVLEPLPAAPEGDTEEKFGRRADAPSNSVKSLKVDQAKIDRLMNLIGEIVVAKNALPYLATRAEAVFGVRDLSREIKTQYAVINRIAEEMQDAIMQVRMTPVSFIFQRFPRLVRDTSRKLGKDVNLVLEGEDTEADKNIIESLGDPLVHIIRNSLDHGFELPALRRAAGKPATGTLTIRARSESDRVVIEIIDDGKGIDPVVIKAKAFEKGLIDEATMERLTDQEALNLIFAAGFSTAEVVSNLSGRGVGMDVVRTAVENVNGTITLQSEKGKGTSLSLSLPLSMAVTNVMIVESDRQIFAIPMDSVLETVRIKRSAIRMIKQSATSVLRGRIIPLKSLNALLSLPTDPLTNEDDEFAVLVVRHAGDPVGIIVDDFHETLDIILKPLTGVLGQIAAYSGSALMGDGSVLMVLNPKEILK